MTTTDLLIPASVAVVWLFGAAGRLVVRRRRAADARRVALWEQSMDGWRSVYSGDADEFDRIAAHATLDAVNEARGAGVKARTLDEYAESALRMLGARGRR